ncbi:hypothetical protein PghCCS26_13440 [Paenibacillus glycanilyticus]|uniref:Lipoprotein n=1 Tax=Paenibacillus glycanilyticus TaxID=126569 RepID=A0ABQ6NGQ5_9BACL|nr:hypothetical protein [Paenibacillus glycanilyticus]GMK44217.1 hypothetical protein PghCCS26_13440 [Paenibacillus glycanilyticus]
MRKHLVLCLMLLITVLFAGCDKQVVKPQIPKVEDVQSLTFVISQTEEKTVNKGDSDASSVFRKILMFIENGQSQGYDRNIPSQLIATNIVTITLKDNKYIELTPGDGVVYVQQGYKSYRIESQDLSHWLYEDWKQDLKS